MVKPKISRFDFWLVQLDPAQGLIDPDQVNHHIGLASHKFVLLIKQGSLGVEHITETAYLYGSFPYDLTR